VPLYLIRHGESEGNVRRIFQGSLDLPLTPLGECQARTLGRWLAAHGVQPSAIHASPLLRAWRTAEILAGELRTPAGATLAPQAASGLREYAAGQLEGLNEAEQEARFPGYLERPLSERGDFAPYGGESYSEIQERLGLWLASLEANELADQDILAVAHGGSLYQLLKLCCGWPVPRHFQAHITNCCCIKLRPRWFGEQLLMHLDWMVPLELIEASLATVPQPADDPGLE
jgi:broad specificity phosphatase PhoE